VIPICPHWPTATVNAIQPACHSNEKAADATRQRHPIVCFANEMYVGGLYTVLHDPAAVAPGEVWMKGKSNVDRRKFH
jgi:hypothetical protein